MPVFSSLCAVIVASAVIAALTQPLPGAKPHAPAPVSSSPNENRQVIAAAAIIGNRCHVKGLANNAPFIFIIDTGDPHIADFAASAVARLGLRGTLDYQELWPGTRYGGVATARLRELRIGAWTLKNIDIGIYKNWRFSFGDDEAPLLGLAALQSQGVRLEVEGNVCRLTLPR
jgi:predicted aspartyl protease